MRIPTFLSERGHKPSQESIKADLGEQDYGEAPTPGKRFRIGGKEYQVVCYTIGNEGLPIVTIGGVKPGDETKSAVYVVEV